MDRRDTEASYGKIWHCLDADGRMGILKSVMCEDINLLPYGKVTYIPGLDGCMSWTGELDTK